MKDRQDQFDVSEMTITFCELFAASTAVILLIGNAHTFIEWSMRIDCTITLEVEQPSIGNLDKRLVDDV